MHQWIHWIVGNADLRFCVICPKIYRSQWTGHSHIVGHCQSEGLWDAILWKHLFQQWDDLVGVALAGWKTSNEDHLWVEVAHYQAVNSFWCEDICGTHLPWIQWCRCRCEGCCSILVLELGAGFTLADYFFDGLVYARPEETSTCKQLLLCYSLMELMQLMWDSLPFSGRNDECFTSQD